MTFWQQAILNFYGFLIVVWIVRHLVVSRLIRTTDTLTARSPQFQSLRPPLVTAIIPAKDEEGALAECLESVCAQSYPNLEILVVDDRSTDRTNAIACEFAKRDPRVRVRAIEALPVGWTGKTHALHVAAEDARGDWLWFLDADTRHEPDCLSIVLEYAVSNGAALASLIPRMRCETFWERVVQPLAGIVLLRSFPLIKVNRDTTPLAFANGQFILIERSAYIDVGGHEAVRDRFVEDIYLARGVKRSGRPIRVAMAPEISSTRMYTSLGQLTRGWSRILYDALGRSVWPLLGRVVEPIIFTQSGYVGFLAALAMLAAGASEGPFAWWLLGLTAIHGVLSVGLLFRMYRMSVPGSNHGLWYPLAGLVMDWIFLRAIQMCLTGRVTWRGTAYGPARDPLPLPLPLARPVRLAGDLNAASSREIA